MRRHITLRGRVYIDVMVHEARVRLRRDGSYVEAVTGGARFVHISGDHESCLAVLKTDTAEQLEEIVDRCSHFFETADILDRADTWLVTRCRCPAYGAAQTIQAHGCSIVWPIVVHDRFSRFHILAPTRQRLEALIDRLEEIGTLVVDRIAEVPGDTLDVSLSVTNVTERLSPNQLEALQLAIDEGYYELPRATDTDTLAETMGISRSTYTEHLRKAEKAIMETFAGLLADHPVLATTAGKGPGRPPKNAP